MPRHRRFKSEPYVRRQAMAFRVFGEIRPLLDRFVLRVWLEEDAPVREIVCSDRALALRQIEIMKLGDMAEYDAYARGPDGGREDEINRAT
jgi:hypothetical protein